MRAKNPRIWVRTSASSYGRNSFRELSDCCVARCVCYRHRNNALESPTPISASISRHHRYKAPKSPTALDVRDEASTAGASGTSGEEHSESQQSSGVALSFPMNSRRSFIDPRGAGGSAQSHPPSAARPTPLPSRLRSSHRYGAHPAREIGSRPHWRPARSPARAGRSAGSAWRAPVARARRGRPEGGLGTSEPRAKRALSPRDPGKGRLAVGWG